MRKYAPKTSEKKPVNAYQAALRMLERRDHTEAELVSKLTEKGAEAPDISSAINRLKEYGFVNDERFAQNVIRYQFKNYSKRILQMKLQQKGIEKELFERVYEAVQEEMGTGLETGALERAVKAAMRKSERKLAQYSTGEASDKNQEYSWGNDSGSVSPVNKELQQKEHTRVMASLYRKGFSMSEIQKAIERYQSREE